MSNKWKEKIMLHDWPECGPGELSIDELYRMFKRRLAREQSQELPDTSTDLNSQEHDYGRE